MSFWLYGIEYKYSFKLGAIKGLKKDTGKCLYQEFMKCLVAVEQGKGIAGIGLIIDVELAAKIFYHLAYTKNKNVDLDALYDACIRSGYTTSDEDVDEKIAPYTVVLLKLAHEFVNECNLQRDEELKKIYPSTDTQSE